MFVAQAAPGTSESTIVSVTPERILDTRNGNDIGRPGPFVSAASQKLQVTGPIATATGNKIVVPAGATGVLLNVTPVSPTAAGFISIRPGDAAGAATTSSLNFTAGGISPKSVQVAMPTAGANAGKIDITFDAYGTAGPTTDVLIDVVGYTTNIGLQQLVADVALKANIADVNASLAAKANAGNVYTKAQVDGLTLHATVTSNGTLVLARSRGATAASTSATGTCRVNFGAVDITNCVYTATPSNPNNAPQDVQVGIQGLSGVPGEVFLQTANSTGTPANSGFVLIVHAHP